MLHSFVLSFRLRNAYRVNSILYSLKLSLIHILRKNVEFKPFVLLEILSKIFFIINVNLSLIHSLTHRTVSVSTTIKRSKDFPTILARHCMNS